LIGNYGINDDDFETRIPTIGGLIVREYNDEPSNFRSSKTLSEIMKEYNIPGISGVDTREITRSIRDLGSRRMLITDMDTTIEEGLKKIKETPVPHDAVSRVSCDKVWESYATRFMSGKSLHVVAVDCGIKRNIIRCLNAKCCDVTIVPYNTPAEEIEKLNPDGIFLSNGPGDPTDVPVVYENIKKLIGKYPIFGICLGHQMVSLAYGAKTCKLKFGHRGGNHPVKNLETDKIEITSQNHSYAVDENSLHNTKLKVTHINILDNTVEGVECPEDKVFSVQYHPESAPGPQDSSYLFDKFIDMMLAE
jgi:carbamoyl-phosphate synthase small subunit